MRILANLNVVGTLDLDSVANAGVDTDRFLVQDANGVVRYRTGAEVASDIGSANLAASVLKHQVKLGEAIAKGQAVYVSSSDGTNMIVSKASNASESTSSKTLGLLETGGALNAQVNVITEGLLAGLDTSTANAGDPVWLGTNGNLIFGLPNKPYAPAHLVFIGIVTRVQQINGEIFIKPQNGFELKEIHDVQITTTPADNTVLSYENSSSLYKMKSIATLLGYTPANAARNITINGTTYDLTADRTWNVGTVTSIGVSVPTGLAVSNTPITGAGTIAISLAAGYSIPTTASQSNWDTAYGWGNHASAGYQVTSQKGQPNGYASLDGGGKVPSTQLPSYVDDVLEYANLAGFPGTGETGKIYVALDNNKIYRWSGTAYIEISPTVGTVWGTITGTLSNQTDLQSALDAKVPTSRTITINGTALDLSANRSWTVGDVRTDGSYANPAWITSLAWSKITGAPAFLTAEADTLATVTGRGNTTSTYISVDYVIATNNGNGTNYRVGDDAWFGDVNLANTVRLMGIQNNANGYIIFGNGDNTALGRAGTGALTYGGNTVYHSGNLTNLNQLTNGPGYITGNQTITLSGDATGSGTTSIGVTLANSGVVAGTYTKVTVDAKGRVTSGTTLSAGDIPTLNYVAKSGDSMTGNLSFGSSGAGITWAANTDGASITFESTGDGASGGRALSNLLIALSDNGDEGLKVTSASAELLYVNTNQFQYKGNTIWHAGNDGSGSGLDADLLDGVSSASFLRSDVVDANLTGTILSTNNANVDGANFEVDTTNKTVNEYAYKVSRSGSAVGGILIDGRGAFASGTTVNGSTVWHQGNLTNLNQLTNGPGYITSSALSSYLPLTVSGTQVLRFDTTSTEHITFQNQTSGGAIQLGFQQNDTDGLHHRAYFKAYKSSAGSVAGVFDIIIRSVGGGTTSEYFRLEAGQAPKWGANTMWHSGNLTNLNQLTNGPGYITGYTETDTLASVTGRGNTTSVGATFGTAANALYTGPGGFLRLNTNTNNPADGRNAQSTVLLLTNYGGDIGTDGTVDIDFVTVDGNSVVGAYPHVRIGYTGAYNDGINSSPEYEARGYFRIATRGEGSGGVLADRLLIDHNGTLRLLNYTTNGFLKFSSSNGTIVVDTNTYLTSYTETDTLATVTSRGNTTTGSINVNGNILMTGTATTTNQARTIDFTGFDKEGVTDFSDRAYIQHTTNTGGHTGSVLVIASENDTEDGIAFLTNASSKLKHNGNNIATESFVTSQGYVTGGPYLALSGGTMTGALRFNEGGFGRIAYADNYHGMILRGIPNNAAGDVTVTDVTSLIQHSGDFRFYRTNGSINELYFQVNATAAYWRGNTIIHSGTIGSQSVAFATNADTVDGYHMNQNVLTTSSPTFQNVTADGSVAAYGLRFRNGTAITYCGFGGGELNNIFHTESAWGNLRHNDISNYEVSADGSSWSAGTLDANIYNLFLGERDKGGSLTIAASGLGRYQRFTFAIGYKNFDMLHITGSTNGESIYIKLETSTDGGSTYTENFTSIWNSWPGNHSKVWSIFNSAITRIRLTIYKPGNNYGNSASINSINYYGGYAGYGERYHMQVYSYDYQSASINRNTFIGGSLTVYSNQTIAGSGYGLYFSGGNNRIYFGGNRAIEGNGTNLQIGEGHSQTQIQSATLQVDGSIVMNTTGTQYIRMGRFPYGVGNSGEAWIGRASDRSAGTMTVQLGGSSNSSYFEVVDHAWSTVVFSAGMNTFNYKGNAIWHAGNLTNLNQLSNGPGYITSVNNLAIQAIGGDSGAFNLDTVSGQHAFVRFSTGAWAGTNPYAGNFSHVLSFNQSTGNGNRTVQLYMGDVPGAIWWRMNQNGTQHGWERIWTSNNLTNLSQLSNGPGYVTGGPYLPLSGGTMTGNLYIQSGGNPTQFNLRGTNPELYVDATYGGGTARLFINRQSNANQATLLFTTGATVTNGTAWNFTGAPIWSMGMTNSSQVSDFKLAYGDIFDANSVALRIDTSKVVYFSTTPYVGGNIIATQSWVQSQGYITGSYLPLSGGTVSGAVTFNSNVNANGTYFNVGGYIDLSGVLYLRSNVNYLNAASNGWNTFLARNGEGFDAYVSRVFSTSHISTTGGNLHTNRGRLAFSSTAGDANHTIYNNYNNIDGEGSWDGMKMNVYNGLDVRTGAYTSPTTALVVRSFGIAVNSGKVGFRNSGTTEFIQGESWTTGFYGYNSNDGFLFYQRDGSDVAHPCFHIGAWNNAGYAGWSNADSMITLVRGDGTKTEGQSYAGRGLSNSSYYSNIIKTTDRTVFRDIQGLHQFLGNIVLGSQQGWDNPGGWNKNILLDGTHHARFRIKASNHSYGNIETYLWADSSVTPSAGIYASHRFSFTGTQNWQFRHADANALVNLQLGNNVTDNGAGMAFFGSTYASSGQYRADGLYIYSNRGNGITIHAEGSNNVIISTNGTNRLITRSDGALSIGDASARDNNVALALNDGALLVRAMGDNYHKIWYYDGIAFGTNSGHGHFRFYGETNTQRGSSSAGAYLRFDIDSTNGNTICYGELRATGDVVAYYSDSRLKKDVVEIDNPIEKVQAIRGVTYTWNEEKVNVDNRKAGKRDIGLIAQEVESIEPLLTSEWATEGNETYKTIRYDRIVALLVEGMKEQQKQIEELKEQLKNR